MLLYSDRSCRVWSLETERIVHKFTGHAGKVHATQFSPDGKILVTGGSDRKLMIWDVKSGNRLRSVSAVSTINSLDINESGSLVVTGHTDSKVRVWNLSNGSLVRAEKIHTGPITSALFLKSGDQVITNGLDNKIHIMETESLKIVKTITDPEYRTKSSLCQAAIRRDGMYVMSGSSDGRVFVWDVVNEITNSVLRAHTSPVIATTWSPNGAYVATSDQSGWVVLWK